MLAQLAIALLVGSCARDSGNVPTAIALEPRARFGWPTPDSERLPGVPADGGILGRVRGMVQGPDSSLYVLERDWNKIVVFAPDQTVSRVIPLSVGEGPGEVRLVRDLALTPEGHLAILDYDQSRVVILTTDGQPLSTVQLERSAPMYFAVGHDTIWVTTSVTPGVDTPSIWALDRAGRLLSAGTSLDAEDRDFGAGLSIALAPDGTVLESSARPGVWRRFSGESVSRQGTDVFPELEPPVVTRTSPTNITIGARRAGVTGIGVLPNGVVVQSYIDYTFVPTQERPPDPSLTRSALVFFEPSGNRLGEVSLGPGEVGGPWYVSPVTGNLFVFSFEPYPAVHEYEIRGLAR